MMGSHGEGRGTRARRLRHSDDLMELLLVNLPAVV
jgi:hypothetical protein